jgi:hypothetical protein
VSIFKRKLDNTAASIPTPGPTTVYHHAPNWFLIILGIPLAAAGILALLWGALWFLFSQMGAVDPGHSAASLVIYGGLIAAGLWFLSFLFAPYFESNQSFKLEIAREITRREEVKLLAAQTTIEPGRMNEADFRFARVILAVMMIAFEWLEKEKRRTFPARWRPWSKSSTLETAEKIGVNITQDKALSVAKWLADEGIITAADSGQVAPAFPTLSSVRAHLDNKYGKPIVVVSTHLRDNRGFKFTD